MSLLITPTDIPKLRRRHIVKVWLLLLDLPSGVFRLHNGGGRLWAGGHEWRGVGNMTTQLVSIDSVTEPALGQAASVTITLACGLDFFRSAYASRQQIKGRPATLYRAVFDPETMECVFGPLAMFQRGWLSQPVFEQGPGLSIRSVSITIETVWSAMNFPPGGRWTDADHQRKHPGDKFFAHVGKTMRIGFED